MALDNHVPDRIRRRYSAKIATVLVLVVIVTIATGGLFYAHVVGDLEPAAEDAFVGATEDRAEAVSLWDRATVEFTTGLAGTDAVAAGDVDRVEAILEESLADRSDRLLELHYADESGVVLASTSDDAVGENVFDRTNLEAPSAGETVRSGPHDAFGTDDEALSFATSTDGGGVLVTSVPVTDLLNYVDTGHRTLLLDDGSVVVERGEEASVGDDALIDAAADGNLATIQPEEYGTEYGVTSATVDRTDLRVVTYATVSDIYGHQTTATAGVVGLLLVFSVNLALVGIVLGGNVSLALRQLAGKAERMGEGDLDVELESRRKDEVATLYGAFDAMRNSLRETLSDLDTERKRAEHARRQTARRNEELVAEAESFGKVMGACATGDLRNRLEPETGNEAMVAIADAFNEMVDDLESTVSTVKRFAAHVDGTSTELQSSAQEIRRASEEVSVSIQEISDGSRRQTDDLEVAATEVKELSATVEEVAATTGNIADQSRQVSALAESGMEDARDAEAEMYDAEARTERVVESIRELNAEAEQIGEIVTLIDEIANQTNMLALNAAIESARSAGDGSDSEGFGVVADEVKELSEETQAAVEKVEETLQSIQRRSQASADEIERTESRIEEATRTVDDLTGQLDAIVEQVRQADDGIQEISRATDDQATSAQELATIIDDVASVSAETTGQAESVAAASEEATATIGDVSKEVETLDGRANRLSRAMDVFTVGTDGTIGTDGSAGSEGIVGRDGTVETDGTATKDAGGDGS